MEYKGNHSCSFRIFSNGYPQSASRWNSHRIFVLTLFAWLLIASCLFGIWVPSFISGVDNEQGYCDGEHPVVLLLWCGKVTWFPWADKIKHCLTPCGTRAYNQIFNQTLRAKYTLPADPNKPYREPHNKELRCHNASYAFLLSITRLRHYPSWLIPTSTLSPTWTLLRATN